MQPYGPPGPGALILPPEVAEALNRARLEAGLSLEQAASESNITPAKLAALEAPSAISIDDPVLLLVMLERLAKYLGLPAATIVEHTLRAWSSAYLRECGTGGRQDHDHTYEITTAPVRAVTTVADKRRVTRIASPPTGSMSPNMQGQILGEREAAVQGELLIESTSVHGSAHHRSVLRGGLWLVSLALLISTGLLGAARAGLIGPGRPIAHEHSAESVPPAIRSAPTTTGGTLLVPLTQGTTQASYSVAQTSYELRVTASRPSWVEVAAGTGAPVFAGILEAGESHSFNESNGVVVEVGAGGTSVSVSAGGRSETLSPPVAPYTYEITIS